MDFAAETEDPLFDLAHRLRRAVHPAGQPMLHQVLQLRDLNLSGRAKVPDSSC